MNEDGAVNLLDVQPFVIVFNGGLPPPTSLFAEFSPGWQNE